MRNWLFALSCLSAAAGTALAEEAKCCFTNAAYSGVCEVTPGKDETCKSILDYLNTPNSAGKSYCGGTSIRGGWEQVSCKPAPKAESAWHDVDAEPAPRSPAPGASTPSTAE